MALSFKRCRQCHVEQELRMFSRQITETFRTAPTAPKVSCNCHQLEGKDVAALQVFHLNEPTHTQTNRKKLEILVTINFSTGVPLSFLYLVAKKFARRYRSTQLQSNGLDQAPY